ncbi:MULTISPECIES: beta-ketoacyl synthase N-terminal-like domain-containing protein [unclassified Lysobacter]|uniref:beta-ketoacyl synthase N-terminal-like domain-containing protein n=1 Tax=unclassified Lysobacter TaxID=2635362 RepID=UPI001BE5B9D3|nr:MULTISPECIES: beta-ketoacyl synthase N-terminal-like domain-containing protein [unclassified Lysobacter]MBT2744869.1 polyketide synthase dehydratase domain-containing protein [Lysobacter sp. ISL-42]MBT2752138.1 polyketide synthase dehydratase domain-containing protein [Lysobacter sp. ISL-50]MBT2778635.1 polyketide synthase dehydratase domain-containing protein [Lysobacter sp. ISL-54]MBT2780434.1 polyketide synthase dehydratase domain-containing protein [Lysobacter sp. ISL-52]
MNAPDKTPTGAHASPHICASDLDAARLPADAERLATAIVAAQVRALFADAQGEYAPDERLAMLRPSHRRWLDVLLAHLEAHRLVAVDPLTGHCRFLIEETVEALWPRWDAAMPGWCENANHRAYLTLIEACLRRLPEILTGALPATDVLFPESSMHLVEGIYKHNLIADHFNRVLGDTLRAEFAARAARGERGLRLLEIGAGTGGTTAGLLPMLRGFGDLVEEYCYTDLSKAFLLHAREAYEPEFPALRTAIFDVGKPLSLQSIEGNRYDAVIATNVLHATSDMRDTVRNAKALLKRGGVLLVNELSAWSWQTHFTFGLLDGWWLYEDEKLRLPGSPCLSSEQWTSLLKAERFLDIRFPAHADHGLGQLVLAARSDGVVRQRLVSPVAPATAALEIASATTSVPAATSASAGASALVAPDDAAMRAACAQLFREMIAGALRMDAGEIEAHKPLEHYGLDSILVVQLTTRFRKLFPDTRSTLFFEVHSIDGLVEYFLEHDRETVARAASVHAAAVPASTAVAPASTQVPVVSPPAVRAPGRTLDRSGRRWSAPRGDVPPALPMRPAADATPSADAPAQRAARFDVAIIGVSGRYPQAPDLESFWDNLASGRSCASEVPADRWRWQDYYDAQKGEPGKSCTRWGGFLDDIDKFDPLFFRIAPKEAKKIDPQERLFLETSYHAIEDAGYTPATLAAGGKVGVFVGAMNSRYTAQPLFYSIANRVSFLFDFSGPSFAVDSACSSSLTAIHLALDSLYSGMCEAAIAGGVSLIVDPQHMLELTALGMLSEGAQCRSFGRNADGFVDAEGVGAVVLKPLDHALRDGDTVHAVIKGSALNAGGRTHGYTVPNPAAQAQVVSSALARADVDSAEVSYIEAHGTGTALGDPIEVAGLTKAFRASRRAPADAGAARQHCAIGSLKSNIGHCESAAGIAALTKVLLQFRHGQLVPTLHAEEVNDEIDFSTTPFRLQRSLTPWLRPVLGEAAAAREVPRIAGISSFGAGGANAHLVLQEPPSSPAYADGLWQRDNDGACVVPLSARTPEQLQWKIERLLGFLQRDASDAALRDIAYTLQIGREAMDERIALVAISLDDLRCQLQALSQAVHPGPGANRGSVRKHKEFLAGCNADPAFAERRDGWLLQRDLARIAEHWVKGVEIDWARLHAGARPRRVRLPNYPFARDRHWIEPQRTLGNARTAAAVHPLLQRNTSALRGPAYSVDLQGDERFLARDAAGRRRLPALLCLEMARAAIAAAYPDNVAAGELRFEDVVADDAILVDDGCELHIALLPDTGDALGFEIYAIRGGLERVHCQGRASFTTPDAQDRADVAALIARLARGAAVDAVHDRLATLGVHGLRAHRLARTGREVVLEFAAETADAESWSLPPEALASVPLAAAWLLDELGQTPAVPSDVSLRAVQTVRVRSGGDRPAYLVLSYRDDDSGRCDIALYDAHGKPCLRADGLHLEWTRAFDDAPAPPSDRGDAVAIQAAAAALAETAAPAPTLSAIGTRIVFLPHAASPGTHARTGAVTAKPTAMRLREVGEIDAVPAPRSTGTSKVALPSPDADPGADAPPACVELRGHGGGVFSIALLQPVLDRAVIAQSLLALEHLCEREDTRVVLFVGAETDLLHGSADTLDDAVAAGLHRAVVEFPLPTVAVLGGGADGSGFLLGALCDFMICARESRYGFSDPQHGAQATAAEAALLAARFGDAWAEDLIYVSGAMSGRELAQKGWTVPVVARDGALAAALSLAERIASKPRESLHLLKTHMAAALRDCVSRLGPHDRPIADASDARRSATVPVALPQTRPGIAVEYLSDAAVSVRLADSTGDATAATVLRDLRATLAELAQHAGDASVVLRSEIDGFLPAIGEATEAQRVDAELAALQQVLCEYPSPVVVAFEGDADGAGWLLGLSADACVHAEGARYSTDTLWRDPSLLRRAAVLFAHRLGANRAKRCLFQPAAVAGAELASAAAVVRGDAAEVLTHARALADAFVLRAPALRARRRAVLARLADAFAVSDAVAGDASRVAARQPMPEFPAIETELRDNGVLVVRMVDREAKNMFSPALVRGLEEVFAHIEASGDYRAVVLCGYDTYFACGGTRDSLLAIQQGSAKFTDTKIYQLPMSCAVPVVAAMQGHAIGGGWSLGMFADLCVFSAESRYISPYMQYGFTPGAGSTLIFPATLGPDLARETLFAAVEHSGSELRAKGLPHPCIARDEVLPHALALADAIAARAPADVRALKRYFAVPGLAVIEDTYARELAMHARSFVGKEHALQGVIRHFQSEEDAVPVAATTPGTAAPQKIAHALKDLLATELQMDAAQIDEDTQFVDLGLDSITGVTWVRKINAAYGTRIEATKVYSHATLRQFCDFVVERMALSGAVGTQAVANAARPAPAAAEPASSPTASPTTITETGPVATDAAAAQADLSIALRHLLAQELHMPEEEIDAHRQFVDLGLDSITGVTWVRRINAAYGTRIEATKVYSHPTLAEFARFLAGLLPARAMQPQPSSAPAQPVDARPLAERTRPAARSARTLASWRNKSARKAVGSNAIAIIGIAGQFPRAGDLDAFWRNIAGGKDCIDTVPPRRWDIERYFSEDISIPGTTNSRWMGVLDDCDAFDPLFFNISPTEAESMDPQQRLMLQNCWHAIENAAIDPRSLSGSRCGVFVGCGASDYHQRSREHQFSSQGFTGAAMSILAARIAYFLNLQGPCLSIDTACSSSLVAISNACDSLVADNCDLALAGGVAVMAGPTMHVKTGQSGMLSTDGRCFAFDHRANGFVPGEGVGALMLKRLADAERDGDIVHAVIRGWGVNQDGKTNGITAPNPVSQTRLMRAVYDRFNIDPEDIQLIEAHGTGTKLGDPIEVEGLTQAFRHYTDKTGYCALGSVKGNIGHTLYAAGVASALKLVLALKHRQLPPAASFERLNPHIDLSDSPFVVNTALKPWPENAKGGRSAVISSFGFSGTNAHLVLEAAPTRGAAGHDAAPARPALIPLSAKTTEQLRQRAQSLADALAARIADDDAQAAPSLHDIAYTLQVGREAMEERCALVAHSLVELEARLRAFAAERTAADMHVGSGLSRGGKLAFIGQDAELKAALIDTCLRDGKLDKLAELWVDGVDLPWAKLHPAEAGRGPRRVELPLYPFARERYWLEDDAAATAQRAEGASSKIHPLLHINASTLRQQRYRSTFDGNEDFLRDHRVRLGDGRVEHVLPGVAYLEMAAAAIADALPDAFADTASGHAASPTRSHGRLTLSDVVWWQPMVVDGPMAVEIELGVEDDGVIAFEVASGSGDGRVLHCQGEARFVDAAGERMADAGLLASAQRGERWSGDEIYAAFARMGLHYGPAHRGIRAISRVGGKLVADLALPAIAGDAWRMPPGIMDSALQACVGFLPSLQALPQAPSVPFTLRSLTLHAPCPSEVVVVLTPAAGTIDDSGGHAAVDSCDVSIFDADGVLCIDIRGFGWRPVDGAKAATLAGSRDAGDSDRAGGFDGAGMSNGTRMVDATVMYDETSMHAARTQQSATSDEAEMFDETFYRDLLESISRKDLSAEDAVELGLSS